MEDSPCDRPDCPERSIEVDLQRADAEQDAREEHFRTCLACGYPTGEGYDFNGNFCSSYGPKLSMVGDALKVNPEFSISELLDYLATKGRPPRKEHLPAMIQILKVMTGES